MLIEHCDLLAPKPPRSVTCIGTNGFIKHDGKGVMGGDPQGYPRVAKSLYKGIENNLGLELERQGRPRGQACVDNPVGNHVALIWQTPMILSFPIKWVWWEDADMQLIERSAKELVKVVTKLALLHAYLHPIGDGRDWDHEVKPLLKRYFDDRFTICIGRL